MKDLNFYDFLQLEVIRDEGIAEIVFDYIDGDKTKPVKLTGFKTDPTLSNFHILEDGYEYYCELLQEIKKLKSKDDDRD